MDGLKPIATWNWSGEPLDGTLHSLRASHLCAEGLVLLNPLQLPPPMDQAAVMIPLYEQGQTGVVLLGPSISQAGYSEAELETMEEAGDFIARLMSETPSKREMNSGADEPGSAITGEQVEWTRQISPRLVELGLRNLYNYAYLADSPLAKTRLVALRQKSLERGAHTLIDRGQAVSDVLTEAVSRLRPTQEEPFGTPSRHWHPYIILRDAYYSDKPNRVIMSRLYISEGTFNRTRRAALCSVARILLDTENAQHNQVMADLLEP